MSGDSDLFPSADGGTQMPVQGCSSSGTLSSFDLQDLENDLWSACPGFSTKDVVEALQINNNFDLDLLAASLWDDEKRERERGQRPFMPGFASPSEDNAIMNLPLDDSDRGLSVNDQVVDGLQLNDHHPVSSDQLTKYSSHEDSPHLQEPQDFSPNYGTYGDPADWASATGPWNHDGGDSTSQENVFWPTYDSATTTYSPDQRTTGTFSLYEEAGRPLDTASSHEDHAGSGEFPFPNVNSDIMTSAVPCLSVKSSPGSKCKYFRLKTPKGNLVLKATPLEYDDSSHLGDTTASAPSSCPRGPFLGGQEVHLLAESVRLEGSSLAPSFSAGQRHPRQERHQSLSLEEAPMKRLPGQHRKARQFLSTDEEKLHHQRQLAIVRSKEQSRAKKENIQLLQAKEQKEMEKNQELGQLCQSLESMRMNCHEIYHQYGALMPSSSQQALHEYVVRGRGSPEIQ
ncbi:uncharacterized protein LOC135199803 [Macrobrachium nipponense]|uniref:uncharacterized protein LOC135199803 n=1 Tax=Macrobrachium nipponense TaxID=159736 RepID=UPI0030C869E5